MEVNLSGIQESAKEAAGNQLINNSTALGTNTTANLESLIQQSENLAKELSSLMNQVQLEAENGLGNEEDIVQIVENLNQMKASINDLIGINEMDAASSFSAMNMQVQQMENRVRELESRSLGSQIKSEVSGLVNNVISSARSAISATSNSISNFLSNVKSAVNNAINNVKTATINTSKAWSEYTKTVSDCRNELSSLGFQGSRQATQNQVDFLAADYDKQISDLQTKMQSSKGLEKLAYKASIAEVQFNKGMLTVAENKMNKAYDLKDTVANATKNIKQTVSDTKDNLGVYVDTAKNEIGKASSGIRNAIVTKTIAALESACTKAKDYANDKGIKMPEPAKENIQEQNNNKDDGPEMA